jgi:hypothetical protein
MFVASWSTVLMADLTDGLVGYWPLDGDAEDISGNDLGGVINGNVVPIEDRFGSPDSAMQFPGQEASHIAIEDNALLQMPGAMTLAAWVFADAAMQGSNNARIVSKQAGGGARSWSLNVENAGLPATFQVASDGNTIVGVDGSPLPTGEWVHMAGVYRPGQALEVYVNGKLDTSNTSGIPDEQFSANGQPVIIGARSACGNCGWLGGIDDVLIYNRDLSENEVRQLMENGPFTAVEPHNKLAITWGTIKQ